MVSITFQPTTENIILFVGGGEVAERRMQLFIEEPCQIVVIAPTVTDTISQWAKENRITWCNRAFTMDDEEHIISSSLLFICTDNHELNDTLYELGKNIVCGPTAVMIRARVALLCRHPLNSAIFILLLVPIM